MTTRTMQRRTKIILGALAGFAVAATLVSCARGCNPESRAERFSNHIEDRYDLTSEQSQSLQTLKTLALQLRSEARTGRDQQIQSVIDLAFAPSLDQQAALAMVQAHTAAVQSSAGEVIAAVADFTDQLSEEQKQAMRSDLEKKVERWQRWHH